MFSPHLSIFEQVLIGTPFLALCHPPHQYHFGISPPLVVCWINPNELKPSCTWCTLFWACRSHDKREIRSRCWRVNRARSGWTGCWVWRSRSYNGLENLWKLRRGKKITDSDSCAPSARRFDSVWGFLSLCKNFLLPTHRAPKSAWRSLDAQLSPLAYKPHIHCLTLPENHE
jgi:hypothetical protein